MSKETDSTVMTEGNQNQPTADGVYHQTAPPPTTKNSYLREHWSGRDSEISRPRAVPLNNPSYPIQAAEPLLSAAIDVAEKQGWQLDSITYYGAPTRPVPPVGPVVQFWAVLVFRAAYRGDV
ncbi:hypothetical protein [Streptomyces sp. NPDC057094]|uniref:hypothetical protein n=1 Tax=Streptomyces sp. NPDC057094 TaxID=3346018 RepID=UPI0036438B27